MSLWRLLASSQALSGTFFCFVRTLERLELSSDKTGARISVSSAWRRGPDPFTACFAFLACGCEFEIPIWEQWVDAIGGRCGRLGRGPYISLPRSKRSRRRLGLSFPLLRDQAWCLSRLSVVWVLLCTLDFHGRLGLCHGFTNGCCGFMDFVVSCAANL